MRSWWCNGRPTAEISGRTPGAGAGAFSDRAVPGVTSRRGTPGSCDLDGDAMKARFMTLAKKPKPVVVLAVAVRVGPQGRAGAGAASLSGTRTSWSPPDVAVNSRRAAAI